MELNKVLLAKTDGKACEDNVIFSQNVRVTVLTPETLRVEYSIDGKFTDLPSQSIWYRNFGKVEFTHETKVDVLCVKTNYAEFYINSHSGSFNYVVIDGKKLSEIADIKKSKMYDYILVKINSESSLIENWTLFF